MYTEILFKAKNSYTGKWVYGFYVNLDGRHIIYTANPFKGSASFVEDIDITTLCQYIGVKTTEGGKDIKLFSGDIVEAWSQGCKATFEIRLRLEATPTYILYPAWQHGEFWNISTTKYEVGKKFIDVDLIVTTSKKEGYYDEGLTLIGNIFDNPELITR